MLLVWQNKQTTKANDQETPTSIELSALQVLTLKFHLQCDFLFHLTLRFALTVSGSKQVICFTVISSSHFLYVFFPMIKASDALPSVSGRSSYGAKNTPVCRRGTLKALVEGERA